MQPLTLDELSLVEDMMSRSFSIPSAKEARVLLKGAASSLQKDKNRKRHALLDTRVVENPKGYRQSKAKAAATQTGTPLLSRLRLSPPKRRSLGRLRIRGIW